VAHTQEKIPPLFLRQRVRHRYAARNLAHFPYNSGMPVNFTLNGKPTTVDVPAEMPLLWVLRDVLHLHGTKYGCGTGQCGACTVHMGGRAVRSCQTLIGKVAGATITTIEGLSADGTHPLQKAWEKLDVPECGYCQAGQIMAAAALLATRPKPTDADIDAAMNTNLCRCGTYIRIRQGIHEAVRSVGADATPVLEESK
jgi:isoquinoline 1-oxidoreductase alpha subunit